MSEESMTTVLIQAFRLGGVWAVGPGVFLQFAGGRASGFRR